MGIDTIKITDAQESKSSMDQEIEKEIGEAKKSLSSLKNSLKDKKAEDVWDFIDEEKNTANITHAIEYLDTVKEKNWYKIVSDHTAVQAIQILLTQWNNNKTTNKLNDLVLDGLFGNATRNMLAEFQKEQGTDILSNSIKANGNWDWLPGKETIGVLLDKTTKTADTKTTDTKTADTKTADTKTNILNNLSFQDKENIINQLRSSSQKWAKNNKINLSFNNQNMKVNANKVSYPKVIKYFTLDLSNYLDDRWNVKDTQSFLSDLKTEYEKKEKEFKNQEELKKIAKYFRWKKYTLEDLFWEKEIWNIEKSKDRIYKKFARTFSNWKIEIHFWWGHSGNSYTRIEWNNLLLDLDQIWIDKDYVEKIQIPLIDLWIDKDNYIYDGNDILKIEEKFKKELWKKIDDIVKNNFK